MSFKGFSISSGGHFVQLSGTILAILLESESELFTGDMSKDNHLPGPVIRGASP